MPDTFQLSGEEQLWLGMLVLQMVLTVLVLAGSRRPQALLQPPVVLMVIFLYYCVAGPLYFLSQGDSSDRVIDVRSGLALAWQGAAIAYGSFLAGYALIRQRLRPPRRLPPFDPRLARNLGNAVNLTGLAFYFLYSGTALFRQLVPLAGFQTEFNDPNFTLIDLGAFTNYALLAVNLLIPGSLLLTAAWATTKKGLASLVLWALISAGIFTTLGFRYRLVILFGGALIVWFLVRRKRPNLVVVIPAILATVYFAGVIGLTRSGLGLDLTALEGLTTGEIFASAFSESKVFYTTAAVMQTVPDTTPFVGLTPILNTLLLPIPSQIIPWKDSSAYLTRAIAMAYGTEAPGAAILSYAEYYLMGGWTVLILGNFALGWLFRRLWLWFSPRQDLLAQVIYVCCVCYLYVVVSRGYLPQVVMLFCFTVLPLFYLYHLYSRQKLRAPLPSPGLPPAAPRG